VLFPAPLSPTSAREQPAASVSDTSSSAGTDPNRFDAWATSNVGALAPAAERVTSGR
jgi:hypothetical protein